MNRKLLKDILLTHADQLLEGQHPHAEDYDDLSSEDQDEISPLFDVAEQVQSTLTPVSPPRDFETDLKKELLTTAHIRQATGYKPPDPERELLILAIILGFVASLVGSLIAWRIYKNSR